jgi:nucleoid DNA-binding protein
MYKKSIIKYIENEAILTPEQAERAYEAVIDCILTALKKDANVNLFGIGTFKTYRVAERSSFVARRPFTKAAHNRAYFTASQRLKRAIN